MTLDVLICTCRTEGIERVARMTLPKVEGVRYIVSWQLPERRFSIDLPEALKRKDIAVYVTNSIGLSKNRNNALAHATADVCLIADDDLNYTAEQLIAVKNVFERDKTLDISAFMYECDAEEKVYPEGECDLRKMRKGWYLTSFELAFRREAVGDLRFNELFGLGSPMLDAGEENVFLYSALKRGLNGRFFPIVITRHEGSTTGIRRIAEPRVLMSKGAYLYVAHRPTAVLRIVLNAWREKRAGRMSFWHAFRHVWRGMMYAYHMGVKG